MRAVLSPGQEILDQHVLSLPGAGPGGQGTGGQQQGQQQQQHSGQGAVLQWAVWPGGSAALARLARLRLASGGIGANCAQTVISFHIYGQSAA